MASEQQPHYLLLGEVLRPHGIRGELRMRILTDHPERFLNELDVIYLGSDPKDNDAQLYKQRLIPIVKNIQKKMKSGKYDHKQAPKLWMYLVTEGAKKYAKEFPGVKFNKQEKEAVAQEFADEYKDEIETQDGEMF